MLPLIVAWGLEGVARAQTAPACLQTGAAYLDADERLLPGPDSAAYRVQPCAQTAAVVRCYYATGALQAYTPCLDLGVLRGTRTTWYEDGRLCTKEGYFGGRAARASCSPTTPTAP